MLKRIFQLLFFLLAITGIWQYQAIYDWYYLSNYQPSTEIVQLADRAQLNDQGKRIFYLSDPKLDNKSEFNSHCPVTEESLVLGCYTGQIFVLRVDREELQEVMEVTAAHEMLHAAYHRLGSQERKELNQELDRYFAQLKNEKLSNLIAQYEKNDPTSRHDELHAILGTQVMKLSPALEAHYSKYFADREKLVQLYLGYEAVFEDIKNAIDKLNKDIDLLKSQLHSLDSQLETKRAQIDAINSQLDTHRTNNNISEYNSLIPEQNRLVREYNSIVATYRDLVAIHNTKVQKINELALEQNELVDSLDSKKFNPL
jgi:chromosome segregation ATPase